MGLQPSFSSQDYWYVYTVTIIAGGKSQSLHDDVVENEYVYTSCTTAAQAW